ncbi:MAG: hypothetical protein QOI55_3079, partial [Actinomycetota bacterium]|nr:hypothetical protein [Actinomycetota bacterium]
ALVAPLGGVFAYSGGTPPNVAAIRRAPVKAVDETAAGAAMHRDPNRQPPHNLHGTPALLIRLAPPDATAPKPLFTYGGASRSAGAVACPHVSITFSGAFISTYDWAAGTGWLRSTPDGKFLAPSGKQIAPTNLVVLWVKDQSPEATVGRGDALVLRGGTLARGTWDRTTVSDPFRLADSTGATLRLSPGTTWVHLALVNNATVSACPAPTAP